MAILEDVPGVQVTVEINGQDVREYNDPDASESGPADCPTSYKYIECIDDAEFSVKARISEDYEWGYKDHSLATRLYVDGKFIRGQFARERDTFHNGYYEIHLRRFETRSQTSGEWYSHKLKFSAINTVDSALKERVKKDMQTTKSLGLIELRVQRVLEFESGPMTNGAHLQSQANKFELAEKSLKGKAISHGTTCTMGKKIETPTVIRSEILPEDNGSPIAVFKFYYRSREALKREMIIPRTPSPDAAASSNIANMSRDEVERLAQERLEQLRSDRLKKEERKPSIKREVGEVIDLSEGNTNSRPSKLTRLSSGRHAEVIDLTDD
ncbi:hypothetical protein F5B20DRAFT_563534 [Whalleya microplaca]|nr:hypothetical protein F5B20DRAFT_563534 [Whalleya microplaca]